MSKMKFRVWNGECMVSPDYINREGIAYWTEDSIPQKSTNIMRCSGLKDKNGKEIYEGDIVKGAVYYGWKNEKGLGVVKYGKWSQDGSDGEYGPSLCLGWYIIIKESEFIYLSSLCVSLVEDEEKPGRLCVIGNIYGTPELIERYEV